jgi:hypothetical protein
MSKKLKGVIRLSNTYFVILRNGQMVSKDDKDIVEYLLEDCACSADAAIAIFDEIDTAGTFAAVELN